MTTLAALIGHGQLEQWLKDYGYLAVFVMVGVESIGVPLPGETMLIVASLYETVGPRRIMAVGLAGNAAMTLLLALIDYDTSSWLIAGNMFVRGLFMAFIFVPNGCISNWICCNRCKVVFFGRFVSILRTYAAALAGANHMPFPRFFSFNASGGIIWASVYGFGYYYAAHLLKKLDTPFTVVAVTVAVGVVVGMTLFIRRNIDEWEERAERALPGPLY